MNESKPGLSHSALKEATPEKISIGIGAGENLAGIKKKILAARQLRIETNKAVYCIPCLT
jgi:hypothetical protein